MCCDRLYSCLQILVVAYSTSLKGYLFPLGGILVWRINSVWRNCWIKWPVILDTRRVYIRCRVRVNAHGPGIEILAPDNSLFVIAQVPFCLCSFRLGLLGKVLLRFSGRAVSHSAFTTHISQFDWMLGEIIGPSKLYIAFVWLNRFIWLVQCSVM